jgi:E2 domain of amyloid precursor protein
VQALEEEGNAEKHQLAAMHQQRVLAHINQRKREAMTCYTQALTELPPNVSFIASLCKTSKSTENKFSLLLFFSRSVTLSNMSLKKK